MRYRPGPRLMIVARTIFLPWTMLWTIANRRGWLAEYEIGTSPYLDPLALVGWRDALENSSVYLEYGSGGSTVEASLAGKLVISVETDESYLRAVEQKVRETSESKASFHPVHVDIGPTEQWGRPLNPWPTRNNVKLWRRYTSAPWVLLDQLNVVPDFIFVDGRFRAASILESFLRLPPDSDCQFMLDDFETREVYFRGALTFANRARRVGGAIMFRRDPNFDRSAARAMLTALQAQPE